jgi:hypothetical protein
VPIYLTVYSPMVPNLTLVDMPGTAAVARAVRGMGDGGAAAGLWLILWHANAGAAVAAHGMAG